MKNYNLSRIIRVLTLIVVLCFVDNICAQTNFKVVLDAGHGGKDPGKNSGIYFEKDIALNVALLVGEKFKKNNDVEVIYTREEDVFIELKERGNIANKSDANLFVSIHCNAHHSQAYGTETYALGIHANERNFEVAKQENAVIFLEDDYLVVRM